MNALEVAREIATAAYRRAVQAQTDAALKAADTDWPASEPEDHDGVWR